MPKLTLDEFVQNLHNWTVEHQINKNKSDVDYKLVPQYIALLEEWDEFLVNDNPRVMKLRKAVSSFCEKITNYKKIDVGIRARAAKFLVSEPEPVVEVVPPVVEVVPPVVVEARPLVPWEDPQDNPENAWNAIPEDMREEARGDLREWVPEEEEGEGHYNYSDDDDDDCADR